MAPAQYFFSFVEDVHVNNIINSDMLESSGVKDDVRLTTIPASKDEVLFRLENIGENTTPKEVDLHQLA